MAIATQNGWKWNVEELQKALDAVEAGGVTIIDAASGLTAGGIQEVLVALATRVKAIDDIDAGDVTVTADAERGLTDGSVQDALVALATRVKGLEDAGLEGAG